MAAAWRRHGGRSHGGVDIPLQPRDHPAFSSYDAFTVGVRNADDTAEWPAVDAPVEAARDS